MNAIDPLGLGQGCGWWIHIFDTCGGFNTGGGGMGFNCNDANGDFNTVCADWVLCFVYGFGCSGGGRDGGRAVGGRSGAGARKSISSRIKSAICSALPQGRTYGANGGIGGIGGQTGSVELVVNYNTGQVSVFASGGLAAGWQGGIQGSVFNGYLNGDLKGDNSGYSGGFSTIYGGDGVGVFRSKSSGGLTGGLSNMLPSGNVTATGVSMGWSLAPTPTGGVTVTNYSKPSQLGPWATALLQPDDMALLLARQACK